MLKRNGQCRFPRRVFLVDPFSDPARISSMMLYSPPLTSHNRAEILLLQYQCPAIPFPKILSSLRSMIEHCNAECKHQNFKIRYLSILCVVDFAPLPARVHPKKKWCSVHDAGVFPRNPGIVQGASEGDELIVE